MSLALCARAQAAPAGAPRDHGRGRRYGERPSHMRIGVRYSCGAETIPLARPARGSRHESRSRPPGRLIPYVPVRSRLSSGRRAGRQDACSDLVEAAAAIHGSIVARSEGDHRLAAAGRTNGGVILARSADGARSFRGGPARRATLRVVHQPLAREEGLFPRREDERLTAIAAGECAVLEHPLLLLALGAGARGAWATRPSTEQRADHAQEGSRTRIKPGLIRTIRRRVKGRRTR